MSELAVGIAVGATVQSSVGATVATSVKHLDRLGKAIETLERRSGRVALVQELENRLDKTRTAADKARKRVRALGDAIAATASPTEQMQKDFEAAKADLDRLRFPRTRGDRPRTRGKGEAALEVPPHTRE